MATIPLAALHLNPPVQQPDPMEQYGRLLQLKNQMANAPLQHQALQQQVQQGQLGLQQGQNQLDQEKEAAKSQKALMQGYTEAGGDLTKAIPLAAKYGAAPDALIKLQSAATQQQTANLTLFKAKGERAVQEADLMASAHDVVDKAPADQKPALYQQQLQALGQAGVDISTAPPQYPGDQAFKMFGIGIQGHKAQLEEIAKQAGIEQTQAGTAKTVAETEKAKQDASYGPTGQAADAKYSFLQKKVAAGQPVTPDDQAWMTGYTKQKTLVPAMRISMQAAAGGGAGASGSNDIKDTAQMIKDGQAPPVLTEYSFRDRTKLAGELHRMGYNLASAEQDWKATQKFLQTANGAQQTRLRQAISALPDLTDKIEGLYNEWEKLAPTSGFKVLNKASLTAMKNLPGRPGAVAQALDGQIADAVSDLAVVYMGGNSPTDHGLALAQKNLSSDWNDDTFREGLKQVKLNAKIRQNSLNVGPVGASAGSPYPANISTQGGGPKVGDTKKFPNGKTGKWDGTGWEAQ